MPGTMDWDDFEEIGIQLAEKFPDTDPLTVRFTDLHKWVTELEGFEGDPKMSNEGKLETIDRKSTRLNSSHGSISYAVFCLKKKKEQDTINTLLELNARALEAEVQDIIADLIN